jgi:hypothetical protein
LRKQRAQHGFFDYALLGKGKLVLGGRGVASAGAAPEERHGVTSWMRMQPWSAPTMPRDKPLSFFG